MRITVSDPIIYPGPGVVVPPPAVVAATRRLVAREGLAHVPALLGVARDVVIRLCGGLPMRKGSLLVARQALAALDPTVEP